MKSFPELLPDAVLGFEHAEDERVLLWLLGGKMGPDNGDPLLRSSDIQGEWGMASGVHAVREQSIRLGSGIIGVEK